MWIELAPKIEALLRAQVAAGHFASVEDAVAAAVMGLPIAEEAIGDLGWARPYLERADAAIDANQTVSESEAFGDLEARLGKI